MATAIINCRAVRRSTNVPLARMATAMQLGLIGFSVAAASVTAEYVTTFWILVFLSQNLREIVAALPARDIRHERLIFAARRRTDQREMRAA